MISKVLGKEPFLLQKTPLRKPPLAIHLASSPLKEVSAAQKARGGPPKEGALTIPRFMIPKKSA